MIGSDTLDAFDRDADENAVILHGWSEANSGGIENVRLCEDDL